MTQIFKNYLDFCNREDKKVNGVSELFAFSNQNYEAQNETNEGCWNCSDCSDCRYCPDCSDCSGCSDCRNCSYCSYCSDCSYCSGCSNCSDCSYCSGCSNCSGCRGCSNCSGCRGLRNASPFEQSEKNPDAGFKVPIIENIHTKVLAVIEVPGHELKMDTWHTCDTIHCRAGWVVFLAGKEGAELERVTSTAFAATQIYAKSSPIRVSPPRFYEENDVALADIKRCAELETKNITS